MAPWRRKRRRSSRRQPQTQKLAPRRPSRRRKPRRISSIYAERTPGLDRINVLECRQSAAAASVHYRTPALKNQPADRQRSVLLYDFRALIACFRDPGQRRHGLDGIGEGAHTDPEEDLPADIHLGHIHRANGRQHDAGALGIVPVSEGPRLNGRPILWGYAARDRVLERRGPLRAETEHLS